MSSLGGLVDWWLLLAWLIADLRDDSGGKLIDVYLGTLGMALTLRDPKHKIDPNGTFVYYLFQKLMWTQHEDRFHAFRKKTFFSSNFAKKFPTRWSIVGSHPRELVW